MTRVDQVELVRHASDAIDSLLVDVHHSTVVVPRLDHSWITARKRELRLSDFPVQSPLREREDRRIVRFFSLSSIHLWRIRWDLGGKVKGKYTHVCFLFFNCTNRAVVVEEEIKSRREVWIIKVVEKSAAVYECCRRWAGNICYHRVKGEFLRKKI